MANIYEGMFLLDNEVVREDWDKAKGLVTSTLEKHGGKVLSARRWDERKLAYTIGRRRRATYLLTYYEIPSDTIPAMRRDFDLSENVARYLMLGVDAVPEGEVDLSAAEQAPDFTVPEPPPDEVPEPEEEASATVESRPSSADKPATSTATEVSAAEVPATGAPAAEVPATGVAEAAPSAATSDEQGAAAEQVASDRGAEGPQEVQP